MERGTFWMVPNYRSSTGVILLPNEIPLPIGLGHLLRIIPQCTSNSKHEIPRQHRWCSGPGYFDLRNIRMPRLSVLDRRCSDQLWSVAAKAPFELLRFCSRQC